MENLTPYMFPESTEDISEDASFIKYRDLVLGEDMYIRLFNWLEAQSGLDRSKDEKRRKGVKTELLTMLYTYPKKYSAKEYPLRTFFEREYPMFMELLDAKHFNEATKRHLSKNIERFVCGHNFASHVFHADQLGFNTKEILLNAQHVHSTIKSSHNNYSLFPAFEYTIINALVSTHHYKETLYYLDYGENNCTTRHSYIDEGYYENLNLMRGVALARMGEKKKQ